MPERVPAACLFDGASLSAYSSSSSQSILRDGYSGFMMSVTGYTLSPSTIKVATFVLSRINHNITDKNKSANPPKKKKAENIGYTCFPLSAMLRA
jgi:hypothetical protein